MADVETLVSGIDYKIHRLIERLQSLQKESETQTKEIHELNQNREEQNQTIKELQEKVQILKTTKTLEIKEGTVEAKAKINELLREIENCIGLLNR